MRILKTVAFLLIPGFLLAQHPITFFTKTEAVEVKNNLAHYPLLNDSYAEIKKQVDEWIGKEVDVPVPKDPAGGYTHEKHKANYTLLFNSGILYNLTGDAKYAKLVRDVLIKYAALNPTLKNHPEATSNSPGRIFWQALNDANWLVYAGMGFDLAYNGINAADRKIIEQGAFKPEVDFFTKDLKKWFNLIHNHGVWACAGVGIVGIATDNKEYVDMALYGSAKDGNGGLIAQMDNLFSPDGYYTEGPYYVRYAILPYYLFANALNHARPGLKVFEHRDRILQKTLVAGLQQTNLDGTFFPINDALKEKDYTSNELVTAIDIAWNVYGKDDGLLTVAKKQDRVMLSKGGADIAAALSGNKNIPAYYPYRSVEFTDGTKGDEGGISLLRNGKGANTTTLLYKYASHGLTHGHFDQLNFILFDKGNEIFTDYGSARFVGVEQKYGGRYLNENKTYASQTIVHNTVVVDETSQFEGDEKQAAQFHAEKLFSNISNPEAQVVAAREANAYKNVDMRRSLYMLQLPGKKKIIVDLFLLHSPEEHQYDLPFQYQGQLISTSFKYNPFTKKQETLGSKNGYQFLWKEAEARVGNTMTDFTFLTKGTYYTVCSLVQDSASIFFTRSGANDPNFNIRREPAYIIRKRGKDQSFINVIEIHGNYSPVTELSSNSYTSVQEIKLLQNDENVTAVLIEINGKDLLIAQSNSEASATVEHSFQNKNWTGPFGIWYDGKPFKGNKN